MHAPCGLCGHLGDIYPLIGLNNSLLNFLFSSILARELLKCERASLLGLLAKIKCSICSYQFKMRVRSCSGTPVSCSTSSSSNPFQPSQSSLVLTPAMCPYMASAHFPPLPLQMSLSSSDLPDQANLLCYSHSMQVWTSCNCDNYFTFVT